jgi:uncharacterized protein
MKTQLLPLALAAVLAVPSGPALSQDNPRPRVIVTGEGEAAVSPDMAIMTLAVMREADTARAALDANNAAMTEVIAAMKEAGVADRDMQGSGLMINPRYLYPRPDETDQTPKINGYQVTNTLTVRVRDLSKLGAILDRSVTLGVNQGGNVMFANDDPAETLTEARKRAVQDAVAKAKTLTEAAGVALGNIVEISEQAFAPPPIPYMAKDARMEAAQASVPVPAGENAYRVQVNVTFELTQP